MLTNLRVAFQFMDKDMMKKMITIMICPKLEYAAMLQKMVPELKALTYEERLKEMGLPTLQDRRERGYLIAMYRIVSDIEKIDKEDLVLVTEEARRTRGHVKKIRMRQCVMDIGKYSFRHRMVEKWNALSDEGFTAHNVHNFKENWINGDMETGHY
ncbi:hypothetical protein E2C01_100264 [Portunus trituberculatus]|uniref:Uncharacterized protein n=1 Tax=Portunus trituberculatus TaxID=210409 RepID=A0A5B7KBK5_PORTR|nr:hypothetical protein [Portunus trituberculatus]